MHVYKRFTFTLLSDEQNSAICEDNHYQNYTSKLQESNTITPHTAPLALATDR